MSLFRRLWLFILLLNAEISLQESGIICRRPEIENGNVPGDIQEYKENNVLHYQCNRGYIREDRPSMCTKLGMRAEWSPTPQCQSIQCRLNIMEGTHYEPAYKHLFLPNETLKVTCPSSSWISTVQETSTVTTCRDDGEWSISPTCQRVRCSNLRPAHVSSWDVRYWTEHTLGATTRYWCERGYRRTGGAAYATCTRGGWTPNPLCEETVGCGTPPSLEDGDITSSAKTNYNHGERVEYKCQSYYTMEGEPIRTCSNGQWIGHMRCLKPCVMNEDDHNQHNVTLKSEGHKYFTHDEIIEFRCVRGVPVGSAAMRQRCNSGVIQLPSCQ